MLLCRVCINRNDILQYFYKRHYCKRRLTYICLCKLYRLSSIFNACLKLFWEPVSIYGFTDGTNSSFYFRIVSRQSCNLFSVPFYCFTDFHFSFFPSLFSKDSLFSSISVDAINDDSLLIERHATSNDYSYKVDELCYVSYEIYGPPTQLNRLDLSSFMPESIWLCIAKTIRIYIFTYFCSMCNGRNKECSELAY